MTELGHPGGLALGERDRLLSRALMPKSSTCEADKPHKMRDAFIEKHRQVRIPHTVRPMLHPLTKGTSGNRPRTDHHENASNARGALRDGSLAGEPRACRVARTRQAWRSPPREQIRDRVNSALLEHSSPTSVALSTIAMLRLTKVTERRVNPPHGAVEAALKHGHVVGQDIEHGLEVRHAFGPVTLLVRLESGQGLL